jgi:DNA repair exonuclease SbcCD nuclease subunit
MRFIHTADWQLGMTRHFLDENSQPRFDEARLDAVRTIGVLAAEQDCEFVVVCGDVFESNYVDRKVVGHALEAMAATPAVDFYLLPGNHDPLDAASVFRSEGFTGRKPPNVTVLQNSEPIAVGDGIELIGAPWMSKHPSTDLVHAACSALEPSGTVRIVAGHGQLDSRSPDSLNPSLIVRHRLEELIALGEIHYVALGDRHSTTDEGDSGRIWYAGAPEPTDYDEVDPGHVLVVDLEADTVTVAQHRVGRWSFERRQWSVTADGDLDEIEVWLESLGDKKRQIVKLGLEGQISLAQKARLDSMLTHHTELLGAFEVWERRTDLVVVPDEVDIEALDLSGFAQEALRELRDLATAKGDPDAVVAQDAVALLYRLHQSNGASQ